MAIDTRALQQRTGIYAPAYSEKLLRDRVLASGLRWIPKKLFRQWAVEASPPPLMSSPRNLETAVHNWYVARFRLTVVGMVVAVTGRWRAKDVVDAMENHIALLTDPDRYWIERG